jgi:hypothetical protein
MKLARVSVSLFGAIAVMSAVVASATIWLVLTDPITVADAVNEGQVTPFVRELGKVIFDALRGILRYL